MQPDWTEQQQQRYRDCVDFAQNYLSEGIISRDNDHLFSLALWKKCAEFGVLSWLMPTQYGGQDIDLLTTIRMLEGLGYGCADNGLTLGLNGQIWSVQIPLVHFGTDEQKQAYLAKLCSGEMLAAHGMTELSSGSDAFNLQTTAVKSEDGYVLNGQKNYVGMASYADLALIFARTNQDAGNWGISAFLVESHTPGFNVTEPVEKMGLRTNPMGNISLQDCWVPDSSMLGTEGAGITLFNHAMQWERGFIFASHVGSMHRQLDRCIRYARDRKQFGQAISQFQAVSHRIVDMQCRLEIARDLLYKVAWLKNKGKSATEQAAIAKLKISEYFVQNSMDAIRIHGAIGYLTEFEVERDLRDATGGVIYSGTSDIQKNIIASYLGL